MQLPEKGILDDFPFVELKIMKLFCIRSISEDNEVVKKPRKRLAMYRTLPDGTVEKEYISYDDPILAKVSFVSKSYLWRK